MTPFQISLVVWCAWGLAFLILEVAAWQDWVPWNTLSWTVWQIFARNLWIAIFGIGLMFSLLLHFAFRWPRSSSYPREDTEGKR